MVKKISQEQVNRKAAHSKRKIKPGAEKKLKTGKKSFTAAVGSGCYKSSLSGNENVKPQKRNEKEVWSIFLEILAESASVGEAMKKSEAPASFIYSSLKKKTVFRKAFDELIVLKLEHAAFDTALKGNATLSSMFLTALMPDKYKHKAAADMPRPPEIIFVDSESAGNG